MQGASPQNTQMFDSSTFKTNPQENYQIIEKIGKTDLPFPNSLAPFLI